MSKINVFFGADSKVGVTMITQVCAEALSNTLKDKEILVLHLDGKEGFDFVKNKSPGSIDSIRAAISSQTLTIKELKSMCVIKNNLYQLRGTSNLLERNSSFNVDIVKNLFELVRGYFDYIFVDAGNSIDSPLSIASLLNCDKRYLITTQQNSAFSAYVQKEQQVFLSLNIDFDEMIINKFSYSGFLDTEKNLEMKYNLKTYQGVPLLQYSWQAEYDKKSLLNYKNKAFNQSIEEIIKQYFPKEEKKKKIFKR